MFIALWSGFSPTQAWSSERLLCFSDVCLGDGSEILETIKLDDLTSVADNYANTADLRTALPDTSDSDRKTLARRVDRQGRFLIDGQTVEIFRRLKSVCTLIAPFVSTFKSESGHFTAIEFNIVNVDGHTRLRVKKIARAFHVKPGTPEYLALARDLSQKFGYKIDSSAPSVSPDGVVTSFIADEQGFHLSFALPDLKAPETDIAKQQVCEPKNRVKID